MLWFPWNGSKSKLLPQLENVFQCWEGKGRFVDPFIGGGSVSRLIRKMFPDAPQIVGDANPWLTSIYEWQVTGQEPRVLDNFSDIAYWRSLTDEYLLKLTPLERVTRFAVCILTSWGNRWETQHNGTFRSTLNPKYCETVYLRRRLEAFLENRWLRPGDEAHTRDWFEVIQQAREGDLVYLDPPYVETLGYGNQWWNLDCLLDVIDWAVEHHGKMSIVISHSSTGARLFERTGFQTKVVEGPAQTKTRKKRGELIAWDVLGGNQPFDLQAVLEGLPGE